MTNLDDPYWPQNHDEIEAFLTLVDTLDVLDPIDELRSCWETRRDEMRAE